MQLGRETRGEKRSALVLTRSLFFDRHVFVYRHCRGLFRLSIRPLDCDCCRTSRLPEAEMHARIVCGQVAAGELDIANIGMSVHKHRDTPAYRIAIAGFA